METTTSRTLEVADPGSGEIGHAKDRQATPQMHQADMERHDDIAALFEEVAELLATLDLDAIWDEATETGRRALLDELIEDVTVHDDHLGVAVHGATRLNVLLSEVGLAEPEKTGGVRGASLTQSTRASWSAEMLVT